MKDLFGNGLLVAPHKIHFCPVRRRLPGALCNYAGYGQGGFPYEVDNFNAAIDSGCGSWKTGWYFFKGPNKTLWRDVGSTPVLGFFFFHCCYYMGGGIPPFSTPSPPRETPPPSCAWTTSG